MRFRVAATSGALVLAALGAAEPAVAADDCMVTGSLNNAGMGSVMFSHRCSDAGPLDGYATKRWWLPQRGAEGYENLKSSGSGWVITAASDVLPLSLLCQAVVTLNGIRITASPTVDMSYRYNGFYGVARSKADGPAQLDTTALDQVLASPHSGTAAFRIDCGDVGSASWTKPYTVLPASSPGREPGVSIDDGADFTNSPEVKLHLGWRGAGNDKVKVSNDGGFAPSKTRVFDLTSADPIPWRLVVLGSERLPKTVYLRFHSPGPGGGGGDWETQTYTDDIVLDTVTPQILSLTLLRPGATSLSAGRRTLRVKAKDNRSGIKSMQVSKGKPRKKAKVLKYRKTVPVAGSGRLFVRVRDGAGNWSKWRNAA